MEWNSDSLSSSIIEEGDCIFGFVADFLGSECTLNVLESFHVRCVFWYNYDIKPRLLGLNNYK